MAVVSSYSTFRVASYMFDICPQRMDSLPDALVQYILSHMHNAKDVAVCNCVSKQWKDSVIYSKRLYFPRNIFDSLSGSNRSDDIVLRMVTSAVGLEELVVYCPFSGAGLASWLSVSGPSLRNLELRMENIAEHHFCLENPSKVECINSARNLETLKLWGVYITSLPKWDIFPRLTNLEIVGARLEDTTLSAVLEACPNLINLVLLGCEGIRSISIESPHLEHCKLDFYGAGNCSLNLTSSKIESLEVQGCSWIRVPSTQSLKNLTIANNSGKITSLVSLS